MSSKQRHRRSKRIRILCAACEERKARFRYRGEVWADRDHTLCFECYRGEMNRFRVRRLAEAAPPPEARLPFEPPRPLTQRQMAHRQRIRPAASRPEARCLRPRAHFWAQHPAVPSHRNARPEKSLEKVGGAARI